MLVDSQNRFLDGMTRRPSEFGTCQGVLRAASCRRDVSYAEQLVMWKVLANREWDYRSGHVADDVLGYFRRSFSTRTSRLRKELPAECKTCPGGPVSRIT